MAMLNNQRVYRKYVQRFFCAMFSFGRAESDEDSHAANMFQFQGTQLLQFLHQTCITQLGWKVHHGARRVEDEPRRDGAVGSVEKLVVK
jgi:hypothetical protein